MARAAELLETLPVYIVGADLRVTQKPLTVSPSPISAATVRPINEMRKEIRDEINRANALNSTGPKAVKGKQRSAMNAFQTRAYGAEPDAPAQ